MCGIAGIVGLYKDYKVNSHLLQKMTKAIAHRGPDDEGLYLKENIGLGHRRLSIIDLSKAGHQPMSNEDGSVWITFNGEIYNYMDFVPELEKKGHQFRSRSDTEMIIHAYEEWGIEGCIERLNGMFAFGLWDKRTRSFYLVRDRLGIKPLFYSTQREYIIFSSEIKSILIDHSISKQLDLNVLSHYLTLFYTASPQTICKEIQQLEAGYYLKLNNGQVTMKQYWDITLYKEPLYNDQKTILKRFDELFHESVKYTLVSDVPVGHLLSRGIDSNSILYYMTKMNNKGVKTFTIDTNEASFSEGEVAQKMADYFHSIHENYVVTPKEAMKDFDHFVWFQDQLTSNSAAIGWHFLYKLVKQNNMKVALNGSGPDEMFAGYETYLADQLAKYLKSFIFRPLTSAIQFYLNAVPQSFEFISTDYKLRKLLEGLTYNDTKAHYWWRSILVDEEKKLLFRKEIIDQIQLDSYYTHDRYYKKTENNGFSFLDRSLYVDTKLFLTDNVLMMADHASMAHSVESRPPLLNHKFVEFAFQIPQRMKLSGTTLKYLMRRGMKNKLPQDFLSLPKKGMNLPLSFWIKNQMKGLVLDILSESKNKEIGLFNFPYIQSLLNDHFQGRKNNMYKIWNLVIFFRWHDLFIKIKT